MAEYFVRRKLQEQGGSLLVTLPKLWTIAEGLVEGDEVVIRFDSKPGLILEPASKESTSRRGRR